MPWQSDDCKLPYELNESEVKIYLLCLCMYEPDLPKSPHVLEEGIEDYIARSMANNAERGAAGKASLLSFKCTRLRKDPCG